MQAIELYVGICDTNNYFDNKKKYYLILIFGEVYVVVRYNIGIEHRLSGKLF